MQITAKLSKGKKVCRQMNGSYFWILLFLQCAGCSQNEWVGEWEWPAVLRDAALTCRFSERYCSPPPGGDQYVLASSLLSSHVFIFKFSVSENLKIQQDLPDHLNDPTHLMKETVEFLESSCYHPWFVWNSSMSCLFYFTGSQVLCKGWTHAPALISTAHWQFSPCLSSRCILGIETSSR